MRSMRIAWQRGPVSARCVLNACPRPRDRSRRAARIARTSPHRVVRVGRKEIKIAVKRVAFERRDIDTACVRIPDRLAPPVRSDLLWRRGGGAASRARSNNTKSVSISPAYHRSSRPTIMTLTRSRTRSKTVGNGKPTSRIISRRPPVVGPPALANGLSAQGRARRSWLSGAMTRTPNGAPPQVEHPSPPRSARRST